eukprot:TRINITY_DN4075_c0_g2_i10.p1 TRINITY_DN4075_c0_g2~~TRINITY_DN4075_c0_g2_i10.p1  ORF type:complete len:252 (+),score=32.36 TRINITY_DN4075_c0_g2_i10:220-975(+)
MGNCVDRSAIKKKLEKIKPKQASPSRMDSLKRVFKYNAVKVARGYISNEATQIVRNNQTVQPQANTDKEFSVISKNCLPAIKNTVDDKKLKRVNTIQIKKNRNIRNEVKDAIKKTIKAETEVEIGFHKSNRNGLMKLGEGKSYESAVKSDKITINIRNTHAPREFDNSIREELEYWQNNSSSIISAIPKHDKSPTFKKLFPLFPKQSDTSQLLDYSLLEKSIHENQINSFSNKLVAQEYLTYSTGKKQFHP